MAKNGSKNGITIFWKWGDQEIENPAILREQLDEMCTAGISGVIASLRSSRYEFVDQVVLRTVARVSQWAKVRKMSFWYQADPRQISRTVITKTGERMQSLFVGKPASRKNGLARINCTKIIKNHFELRYELPALQFTQMLKEGAVWHEPFGLERAFIFRMEDNLVIKETVRDITPHAHFYTNLIEEYSDVFGDVRTPEDEEWWVVAFPKYNTNQYDFAGRDSKDMLLGYVEDLFDACTHLDGITWGEGGGGYLINAGYLPVSLSLYNCFIAEYQYDIRDSLYALVLDVDDRSHIRIRNNYFTLLMDTVSGALQEFYAIVHAFFSGIDVSLQHTWHMETTPYNNIIQGSFDPWRNLGKAGSAFLEIKDRNALKKDISLTLANLCVTKSLGVHSRSQKAYLSIQGNHFTQGELRYWSDLLGLLSIRCVSHTPGGKRLHAREAPGKDAESPQAWNHFKAMNQRLDRIFSETRFNFPRANIALIFPVETIMASHQEKADRITVSLISLIARLFRAGIQFDVSNSDLCKEGKLGSDQFIRGSQRYEAILYPYPEIMDEAVLESVSLLMKYGFPVIMGGPRPAFTTTGKRIPHEFEVSFHPEDDDLTPLFNAGIKPLFTLPQNSLATMIEQGTRRLYCLCANSPAGSYGGILQHDGLTIPVPESKSLRIYQSDDSGVKCIFE